VRNYGAGVRAVDVDSLYLQGTATQKRLWNVDAPECDEVGYGKARTYLSQIVIGRRISCKQVDED